MLSSIQMASQLPVRLRPQYVEQPLVCRLVVQTHRPSAYFGIYVVNIRQPVTPSMLSSIQMASQLPVRLRPQYVEQPLVCRLVVQPHRPSAYFGIYVVNIRQPVTPSMLSSIQMASQLPVRLRPQYVEQPLVCRLVVQPHRPSAYFGIYVVNIRQPVTPSMLSSIQMASQLPVRLRPQYVEQPLVCRLVVQTHRPSAYFGIYVVNIRQPVTPIMLSSIQMASQLPVRLRPQYVEQPLVFRLVVQPHRPSAYFGIYVVNIRQPVTPSMLSSIQMASQLPVRLRPQYVEQPLVCRLVVQTHRPSAYFGIYVVNIRQPVTPIMLSSIQMASQLPVRLRPQYVEQPLVFRLVVQPHRPSAYFGIYVVNIRQPVTPIMLSSIQMASQLPVRLRPQYVEQPLVCRLVVQTHRPSVSTGTSSFKCMLLVIDVLFILPLLLLKVFIWLEILFSKTIISA